MRRLFLLLLVLAALVSGCTTGPDQPLATSVDGAQSPPIQPPQEPGAIVATVQAQVPAKAESPQIIGAFFTSPNQGGIFLEGGGVLTTADGGQSWQSARFPFPFTQVAFYTEQFGLARTADVTYRTTDGGNSWTAADTTGWPRFPWLGTMQFLDERRGWGSTFDNRLPATTDGGHTWTPGETPCPEGLARQPFSFVSPETGWLLCGFQEGSGFMSKRLFRTDDGGHVWRLLGESLVGPPGKTYECTSSLPIGLPCGDYAGQIQFVDAEHGWYVGIRYGDFFATDDGGRTWRKLPNLPRSSYVHFLDARDGFRIAPAASFDQQALSLTHDGGVTWAQVYPMLRPQPLFYLDEQNLVGLQGDRLYRSADGGQNWQHLSRLRIGESLVALAYTDPKQGWLLTGVDESRRLYRTDDGGLTWRPTAGDAAGWKQLGNLVAIDGQTAYLSDGGNRLQRTRDGGASFVPLVIPPDQFAGSVDFSGPGTGLLARGGLLYTSRDGGTTWQVLSTKPRGEATSAALTRDGRLWAMLSPTAGVMMPISSTDGGVTWTAYSLGGFNQPSSLFRCGLSAICVRSGGDGSVIVSHDSGKTWRYR